MVSIPSALIFGIVGVVLDRRKGLAIAMTLITGALIGLYLYGDLINLFC